MNAHDLYAALRIMSILRQRSGLILRYSLLSYVRIRACVGVTVQSEIPQEVAAKVRSEFRRNLDFAFAGWPHGQSMMWRATDGSGPTLYVKVHALPYLYERHLHAITDWIPLLSCDTPQLLFRNEPLLLMVFAELPGEPLESATVDEAMDTRAYEMAGSSARSFHEIPVALGKRIEDPVEFAAKRLELVIELARGLVDEKTLEWVVSIASDLSIFEDEHLVPCHRDYSPRNWLVSVEHGTLRWSLIDFERSKLDFKYMDFQRMWDDHWVDRPDRRKAFFQGYGRTLTSVEERKLKITVLLNRLGTIRWGIDNGDLDFANRARQTLQKICNDV